MNGSSTSLDVFDAMGRQLLIFSSSFLIESISRMFLPYFRLEAVMLLRSDIDDSPLDGINSFFSYCCSIWARLNHSSFIGAPP